MNSKVQILYKRFLMAVVFFVVSIILIAADKYLLHTNILTSVATFATLAAMVAIIVLVKMTGTAGRLSEANDIENLDKYLAEHYNGALRCIKWVVSEEEKDQNPIYSGNVIVPGMKILGKLGEISFEYRTVTVDYKTREADRSKARARLFQGFELRWKSRAICTKGDMVLTKDDFKKFTGMQPFHRDDIVRKDDNKRILAVKGYFSEREIQTFTDLFQRQEEYLYQLVDGITACIIYQDGFISLFLFTLKEPEKQIDTFINCIQYVMR